MRQPTNQNRVSEFLIEDRYHIHRHVVLQLTVLVISIGIFFDAPDRLSISLNRFYGWISYFLFLNMLVYVNRYLLFPRFLAANRVLAYVVSVVLFTIFALLVMVVLQQLFYDIAITHQQPPLIVVALNITSSMFAIFLFLGGISTLLLFKQWIISNRNINNLQISTFQSELNFLKSQINPHFLFNMLNNAHIMIDDDPEMAAHILHKLDDMLQYQFNDSTQDTVCLKSDIAFLTDFLDLEKIRRDYFEYTISIDGNPNGIRIPPLLFIPFVENAVKHNLDTKKSYVRIVFRITDQHICFECENSKPENPIKRDAGGLGLVNIKRRLDLLYRHSHSLNIEETRTTYSVNLQLNR